MAAERTHHGRRVAAGLVASLVLLGGGAVAVISPTAADAAPIQDADPAAGHRLGDQIAQLDLEIRSARAALPGVEAVVGAASAALDAGRASDERIQRSGLPPTQAGGGTAVDTATNAILGDLAPEQTTAAIAKAIVDLTGATTRRDDVRSTLATATDQRTHALAELERSGETRTRWSVALLDRLGAPVTSENLRALAAWIGAESNDAAFRNPLATTMGAPGARDVNAVGVKSYPTDDAGLDATVRTLRNGLYDGVVTALLRGDSALRVVTAVAESPWGTGANAVARLQSDGR